MRREQKIGRLMLAGALGAATMVAVAGGPGAPAAAAGDPPVNCEIRDAGGQCVGTNHRERPGSEGGASSRGPLTCATVGFEDRAYALSVFPEAPELIAHGGGAIWFVDCGRPSGNGEYDPWERVGASGTLNDGTANLGVVYRPMTWADPAEVAQALLAQVIATLPPPEPIISPPPTGPAILDQPTFVAVANWPGTIGPLEGRDGPVEIELTAVPRLVFTPGDGSPSITCEGRGTLFDPSPSAPEPAVQAEGACAHVYRHRTGDGAWPGSLAIHWEVTWTSVTPDDDGVIDAIPQGVPVPRQVDEVHGLVVDSEEDAA